MAMLTARRRQELNEKIISTTTQNMMDSITLGIVADTNDPQQMGRVRVVCQRWGDSFDSAIEDIPWAVYSSPFAGQINAGTRGPGIDEVAGGVAYGMWAIPVVGAQVLVMCIDSDPNQRVYIGSVFDQFTPHTLPHGRFMYDDHPNLDDTITPSGPYSSTEKPIEPLSTNLRQAFGNKEHPNYEWQNRAADYTATALDVANLESTYSSVADDKDITKDDWTSRQGYQTDRQDPTAPTVFTERNFSPMVYSFTSPGFHALSMDDRMENCRVRLRTTSGHQILMDDTNERIYIATAKGENWIEMDQTGNVDIYSTNKVNIRAKKGINYTTDEDFRVYASKSIHMIAQDEIRLEAKNDIHVMTGANIRIEASASIYAQAVADIHTKSGAVTNLTAGSEVNVKGSANVNMSSGAEVNVKGSANVNMSAGGDANILAGGNIIGSASLVEWNGPGAAEAAEAASATPPSALHTKWTHRVPAHEPYARVMTKDDFTHEPELAYDDPNVNKMERGQLITRGLYWRR